MIRLGDRKGHERDIPVRPALQELPQQEAHDQRRQFAPGIAGVLLLDQPLVFGSELRKYSEK